MSVLDIGCGSGLFSLAAVRLGASRVHSFDFDPTSATCTAGLKRGYAPGTRWTIETGNVLDREYVRSLGEFDLVYAWGVLHHTGDMWTALDIAGDAVAPDGRLFLAIYNDQGRRSRRWRRIKRTYNSLPARLQVPFALVVMSPGQARAGLGAASRRLTAPHGAQRPKRARGMSRWHDLLDWCGGYPFEVATGTDLRFLSRARLPSAASSHGSGRPGLQSVRLRPGGRPMTARSPRRRRTAQPYDVLFYAPGVGALVSEQPSRVAGGSETQALRLARALARDGLRVAMVAYDERGELPRERGGVHFVPRPRRSRASSPLRQAMEAIRITRALARAPSCGVVVRVGGPHVGWVVLYARLTGRRAIFASASLADFDCMKVTPSRVNRALYRLGVRLAHEIVVQTQEQLALCQTTFRRTPILIGSIAAPAAPQRAAPEAFIWIGRLLPYKRPFDYVDLARALPEAEFWMVAVPSPRGPDRVHERLLTEADEVPNLKVFGPRQ